MRSVAQDGQPSLVLGHGVEDEGPHAAVGRGGLVDALVVLELLAHVHVAVKQLVELEDRPIGPQCAHPRLGPERLADVALAGHGLPLPRPDPGEDVANDEAELRKRYKIGPHVLHEVVILVKVREEGWGNRDSGEQTW